ncbi:MAG: YcaQ family DNA glycosylase [Candidatus Micrarchaeota archaeon]|nr:YcaQ family DNA glycosylase [Candidatus Micrarchaeota archaeon]
MPTYNYDEMAGVLKQASRNEGVFEMEVTNEVVRDLAFMKQRLDKRSKTHDKQAILEIIRRIGLLQIDSINTVERSHYLVVLSRIGPYEKKNLDELLYPDRALFEQRSHANCFIPIESYPFYQPEIASRREAPIRKGKLEKLGRKPDAVLGRVLEDVREKGPLSSMDFESDGSRRGGWWNRKPEREALDILWKRGYLAVDRRKSFRCYYDLTERVIPNWLLKEKHSVDDFKRWTAINGLDAIGIGTVADIADYFRQKPAETRRVLAQLVEEGVATKIKVSGWKENAYALSKDLKLVDKLKKNPLDTCETTLLSPFDNLIWFRERTERLFGLRFRIEMYTPKSERTYGYYSMPILYDKQIIGKADPKADRRSKTLMINNIHLENEVTVDQNLVGELSRSLKEFARFNDCDSIRISKTTPSRLKSKLEEKMRGTKIKAKA